MSDHKRSSRLDALVAVTALLIFAAGAGGALVLGAWRVARLGLITAMVVYVLAFLVAMLVRTLRRPKPPKPDHRGDGR